MNGLDIDVVTLGGLAPDVAALVPDVLSGAYRDGLMRFRRADPPPVLAGSLGVEAPDIGAAELVWGRLWARL